MLRHFDCPSRRSWKLTVSTCRTSCRERRSGCRYGAHRSGNGTALVLAEGSALSRFGPVVAGVGRGRGGGKSRAQAIWAHFCDCLGVEPANR
eukprot:5292803-Pleurochrysis_carterae.AAC.1